ncbi:MAG: hypothetical protein CR971_00055 [candidate division SR1 bacterium]|nr:MAG: hypothetical protein CR971_00055 [candidate division SR1 bacterium]
MLRNVILKKYIDINDIKYSVGHEFSVFLPLLTRIFIVLTIFLFLFIMTKKYFPTDYVFFIFLGIGGILFIKFIIDFFDLYLDTLTAGEYNITLFMWDGFFNNSTEIFDWDRIESISYRQNSFWDKLFMKGDILIRLDDDIEFPFEDVYRPKKVLERLTIYKNAFIAKKLHDTQQNEKFDQDERFTILVDALSEVVKDYSRQNQ